MPKEAVTAAAKESSWTLAIWTADEDGDIVREIIWTGTKDQVPDLLVLSRILPTNLQPMQITDLSTQILQQAPTQHVPNLLTILACCGCRRAVSTSSDTASSNEASSVSLIDTSAFHQLAQSSKKSTCGRVFKKGDLVWQCRQCGKDIACVQCDPCFRKSNHVGHEVYFHRSSGGAGCCDCGDPEAWLQQGNCCDHSPPTGSATGSTSTYQSANQYMHENDDPANFSIPSNIKSGFRAVMEGVSGLLTTYVICQARGFTPSIQKSSFLSLLLSDDAQEKEKNDGEVFQLSVHNDDVHSYDEVIAAFRRLRVYPHLSSNSTETSAASTAPSGFMDMATAREYTTRIDKEGAQIVLTAKISRVEFMLSGSDQSANQESSGNLAIFEEYFRILHEEAGLQVSFLPLKIARLDSNLTQSVKWLIAVGDVAQGLRRLATRVLLLSLNQHQSNVAYQAAVWMPSELDDTDSEKEEKNDEEDGEEEEEESNPYANCNAYDMTRDNTEDQAHLFPQEISSLIHLEPLDIALSASISGPLSSVSSQLSALKISDDVSADFEKEVKARLRFPFLFLEKSPISIVLLAHPFLSKHLQTAWNDLVIRYQYDILFKSALAQTLTVLYPVLMLLFGGYVGTVKDTVLRNTVQIYTANTVVEAMSSQCLALLPEQHGNSKQAVNPLRMLRPLEEPRQHLFITNMLFATFYTLLQTAGMKKLSQYGQTQNGYHRLPDQRGFIHHSIITKRRYGQICRDLEYTAASPSFCSRMLQGKVNAGSIALWLDICEALSFLDTYSRLTHAHIEIEDEGWQYGMNLVLEVESVSTHIVCSAFLSQLDSSPSLLFETEASRDRSGSSVLSSAGEFDFHQNLLRMSLQSSKLASRSQEALCNSALETLSRLAKWSYSFFGKVETVGVTLCQTVIYVPKYIVSKSPISIHLPLHRFLGKILQTAIQAGAVKSDINVGDCLMMLHRLLVGHRLSASHGTDSRPYTYDPVCFYDANEALEEACSRVGDDENILLLLLEAPMMALVFVAQERLGMWRRNGIAVANLAYNYSIPVLSKYYRETDLVLLQAGVLTGLLPELRSGRTKLSFSRDTDASSGSYNYGALTSVSFQRFVALLSHRFELAGVLEAFRRVSLLPTDHPQHQQLQQLDDTVFLLLSEFLKLFCQLLMQIPTSYAKTNIDMTKEEWKALPDSYKIQLCVKNHGLMAAVMREVVHQVLGGSTSMVHIARIKSLIGSPQRTVSDKLLQESVSLLCTVVGDSADTAQTLTLKDAAYQLYDPEYGNLSTSQATTAFDRVKDRLKLVKKQFSSEDKKSLFYLPRTAPMNPYVPMIFPLSVSDFDRLQYQYLSSSDDSLPANVPENAFYLLRTQMFTPYFGELMFRFMSMAMSAKSSKVTLIGHIVQLLTLQLHCRPSTGKDDAADWLTHYDTLSVYHLPLIRLLVPMFTDKAFLADTEPFYYEGLGYVLYEVSFHNKVMRDEAQRLGFSVEYYEHMRKIEEQQVKAYSVALGGDGDVVQEADYKPKKKKKVSSTGSSTTSASGTTAKLTAQQKALEKMKTAASMFATKGKKASISEEATAGKDESSKANPFAGIEDDSDDEKEETDVCILCKEKKEGAAKGFLSFVQSSAVSKNILLKDLHLRQMSDGSKGKVYRVVALHGCEVFREYRSSIMSDFTAANNQESVVVGHLKYGDTVRAFYDDSMSNKKMIGASYEEEYYRRGDCWLYITSPIVGWVCIYVSTFSPVSNTTTLSETKDFVGQVSQQREHPASLSSTSSMVGVQPFHPGRVKSKYTRKILTQLAPADDFCFLRSGGDKLHVATCGHAMHFSCYDEFYSANYARHLNQPGNDYFWIDIEKGECLCPLCKSISNTLLPVATYKDEKKSDDSETAMDIDEQQDSESHKRLSGISTILSAVSSQFAPASGLAAMIFDVDHGSVQSCTGSSDPISDRRLLDFLLSNAYYSSSQSSNAEIRDSKGNVFSFRNVDNWYYGKMHSIRGLSLLVQATAYSVLQHVAKAVRYPAVPIMGSSKASAESTDEYAVAAQSVESNSDLLSLKILVSMLSRVPHTILKSKQPSGERFIDCDFAQHLLLPFLSQVYGRSAVQNILSGKILTYREMDRTTRLATRLPWSCLNSSLPYPDDVSKLHVLLKLQQIYDTQSSDGKVEGEGSDKTKLPLNTWHFCSQPLLLADLQVVLCSSIAVFGESRNAANLKEVWNMILQAKIIQCLMEPGANLSLDENVDLTSPATPTPISKKAKFSHHDGSSDLGAGSDNMSLSFVEYGKTLVSLQRYSRGLPYSEPDVSSYAALKLLRHVLSSLVVFVECIVRLSAAIQGFSVGDFKSRSDNASLLSLFPENKNIDSTMAATYSLKSVWNYANALLVHALNLNPLSRIISKPTDVQDSNDIWKWCEVWISEVKDFHAPVDIPDLTVNEFSTEHFVTEAEALIANVDLRGTIPGALSSSSFGEGLNFSPEDTHTVNADPSPIDREQSATDAMDDYEDLDALNDMEVNNVDNVTTENDENGVPDIVREATMENLRSFLRSLPANNRHNNVPDLNAAVQTLAHTSRTLNAELNVANQNVSRLELELGIRQRSPAEGVNNRQTTGQNNTDTQDTSQNTTVGTTWAETERLNAERSTQLIQLRTEQRSLVRRITRNMALLMMLMTANDNNISAQQILQGDVNIQFAPQALGQRRNQFGTLLTQGGLGNGRNPLGGFGEDNLFPTFVTDNNNNTTSNLNSASNSSSIPAPVFGKSLWPLYGVDPSNAFLTQMSTESDTNAVVDRVERFLSTFTPNLFEGTTTNSFYFADLSPFSLHLDFFHDIKLPEELEHDDLLVVAKREASNETWGEFLQPCRMFIALPRLYTDLYTRTKFPTRLKLNKLPKATNNSLLLKQSETVWGTDDTTHGSFIASLQATDPDEDDEEVDDEEVPVGLPSTTASDKKPKRLSLKDPAICLVCGRLLSAAQKVPKLPLNLSEDISDVFEQHVPGECTLHALECGGGTGIFYLVSSCQTLLCRDGRAITAPSVYVDSTGEAAQDRNAAGSIFSGGETRPMYLSEKRMRKLEEWYLGHIISKEVTRKRQGEKSVIRLNWF